MSAIFIPFILFLPYLAFTAPPDAPTIRLYHYDTSKIVLIWDPPANDGGSPITSATVFMKEGAGSYVQVASLNQLTTIASLTTFNSQPFKVSAYSLYATATNADGTSPASQIITINLQAPTSAAKSSVASPPAEIIRNTAFTLTVQTYDSLGNKKTSGGNWVSATISDVCKMNGGDSRCFRVGTSDSHYVADILTQPIKTDLTDNGDGTYSGSFTVTKAGYVTVNPVLFVQGGIYTDAFLTDCTSSASYQGGWSLAQITPRLNWGSLGELPGGRGCMFAYMYARLRPPFSADYTFNVDRDDDFKLNINGVCAMNAPCCGTLSATFHMDKHGIYDVNMAYNEVGGGGKLFLAWFVPNVVDAYNIAPDYWWYPQRIGAAPFDIKVNAPPVASSCTITGLTSGGSVSEDTVHSIQITTVWDVDTTFRTMPDTYEIKIIGPSPLTTETSYTATDSGNYVYTFDYTLAEPGAYQLSIKLSGEHIQNSPLSFTVYACHKYCIGCTGTLNSQCVACNSAEKAYPNPTIPTNCDICHPGFHGDAVKKLCVPCSIGQYQDLDNQDTCKSCEAGKYQNLEGQASCALCPLGTYMVTTGASICTTCPEGKTTEVLGAIACDFCIVGWYPSVDKQRCLYKGIFTNVVAFNAHAMSTTCFDSNAKLIKPYTSACRAAYRSICCAGSSKVANIDCNYALDSLADSMRDKYCSACTFMDQTQCPANKLCWDDTTWTDNNVSPYPESYSKDCLFAAAPYCGPRLNINLNDPECNQIVVSCQAKVTNSQYIAFNTFKITFDKAIPATLPNCNQIFNSAVTPVINSGVMICTRASDYSFEVEISKLKTAMNSYSFAYSVFTDACGIYYSLTDVYSITPPSGTQETLILSGSSTDKCMGLYIDLAITKSYVFPVTEIFWEAIYIDSTGVSPVTLDRLTRIGNFNKTKIFVPDYDLFPDKLLQFKAKIRNPYNLETSSEYFTVIVPRIASGKRYCGPCQLNDRIKCVQFNNICWIDYMNYTVIDPFNTSECLKAMAPICYQIWSTSTVDDPQCLDFKNYYNYTAMKIKPALLSAAYSGNGKIVALEFNVEIKQGQWADCSNVFEVETLNWLPSTKSCRWTSPKILEVDYEPQAGIMQQLTIKSKSFYYEYIYAQDSADQATVSIKMPPLDATLKINGITSVSECDTLNLFGTVATQTLYQLILKWDLIFEPNLSESLLSELNTLLEPYAEFGKLSSISIPSKFLKQGSKITVTLSARAANVESKIISTSTIANVFGNIPKVLFTSKSQYIVELNGNKLTSLPILIDNSRCVQDNLNSTTNLIPIDLSFSISSGDSAETIITKGTEESEITNTLLNSYSQFKSLFIGNRYGFKYLKYYNFTAIVTDKNTGAQNSDTIILFINKPPLKSVIDSPGTLVSISTDVQLNGANSEFPALETDAQSFIWKCISASSMELGGSCDCPILTESGLKSSNLRIPKDKLVKMCKYKFSLTVKATIGTYLRTAYNETEFMTYEGPAIIMKAKLAESTNPQGNDMYLTFGTDLNIATGSNANFKWTLTEVESTDPKIQEKYSERNTFVYDFFKNELKGNPDPAIKAGDINIPNGTRRRKLADLVPNFTTPTTTRILGIDKSGLIPLYKYTFAVTVFSVSTPSFLFIQFTNPPSPRHRVFKVVPQAGTAFETNFRFSFTLPSTTDIDEAYYQLFRKDCPGSGLTPSLMTQKFTHANSFEAMLGPSLAGCDNQVEIILRIYEYNSYIDVTTTVKVKDQIKPLSQVLNQQALSLSENKDLTLDQKLSIMSAISNVRVTEVSEECKAIINIILEQIDMMDKPGGILDLLEPKEQVALLGTVTDTLANLVASQAPNIELNASSSISNKVDGYLTTVNTKEGGTFIIPSALAAMSGIADIGTQKQSENTFFKSMQNAMNKMSDMKLAEMLPGTAPFTISSPSIEMIIKKNFASDYNQNKTFETAGGVNIQLPDGMADLMINSMNTTANGTVTFGASVYTTNFNPFANIKNSTNISVSSLSVDNLNGVLNTTVKKIYEDMSKGLLDNVVNKKEQDSNIVQLSFKPFQLNNDASEKSLNSSVHVGDLPDGKEASISIPASPHILYEANSSLMVPLFYVPETEIWSNQNCSLDRPTANRTNLNIKCTHMGKGTITGVDQGFTVSVDLVKDVFKVIKAGNYQQLISFNALADINDRTISAYVCVGVITIAICSTVSFFMKIDTAKIHKHKLNCLLQIYNKKATLKQKGLLFQIMRFFSRLRKKGMKNMSKTTNKNAEPAKTKANTESKIELPKKIPKVKSNGFTTFSVNDKKELEDTYKFYQQCQLFYKDEELNEILFHEFENSVLLTRITRVYIDDIILVEPVTLWRLMKNENMILNTLLKPEITTPRCLKFLTLACILLGELFVSGYFYNPKDTAEISENTEAFFNTAIVYSIAAALLMIPLKIIIGIFMTGKVLTDDMTREQVETAERSGPTFKLIGLVLGFAWLGFCLYSIMMYIINFTQIALINWMTTYGISVFTELFIIGQLRVAFKVVIGLVLMKIAKSKFMMTAAGIIADQIVNNLIAIL